jgi:syntaxin 1B/2/3
VQSFLAEEQRYKGLCREQIARQYRIVNPDSTPQETQAAVDRNWGEDGVFQSAVGPSLSLFFARESPARWQCKSQLRDYGARTGQASSVLGAVKARQTELQQVERSISELAQLFQDLETLVIEQEAVVAKIEDHTQQADVDLTHGIKQVQVAQRSVLNRRKLKWICLGIVLAIIAVVVIILAIWFGVPNAFGRQPAA